MKIKTVHLNQELKLEPDPTEVFIFNENRYMSIEWNESNTCRCNECDMLRSECRHVVCNPLIRSDRKTVYFKYINSFMS